MTQTRVLVRVGSRDRRFGVRGSRVQVSRIQGSRVQDSSTLRFRSSAPYSVCVSHLQRVSDDESNLWFHWFRCSCFSFCTFFLIYSLILRLLGSYVGFLFVVLCLFIYCVESFVFVFSLSW